VVIYFSHHCRMGYFRRLSPQQSGPAKIGCGHVHTCDTCVLKRLIGSLAVQPCSALYTVCIIAAYSVVRCLSVRRSVCLSVLVSVLSRSCIVSKRVIIPSNIFNIGYPHHSGFSTPKLMAIFRRWSHNRDIECTGVWIFNIRAATDDAVKVLDAHQYFRYLI